MLRIDPVQTARPAPVDAHPVAGERWAEVRRPGTIDDPVVPAAEVNLWAPQSRTVLAKANPNRAEAPGALSARSKAGPTAPVRVPLDARTLALLAQDVYQDAATPPAGWRVAGTADLRQLGISAANLENPTSGFRARVYVEGQGADARYVVSFRGSQGRGDWVANAQQAVGAESDHYRRALLIGERLSRAQGLDVHLTGHSLGGGLASASALAAGREGTTFNAAGLSDRTIAAAAEIRSAAGIPAAGQIRAFYVRGEVLSAIQDGGDRVAGGLLGRAVGGLAGPLGSVVGGVAGRQLADAPEAHGTRIGLDARRPEGTRWWGDNPVARHGMDWVLSSLPAR